MRTVDRSALVPWSAAAMYALVADVPRYPEFLPWCTGAEIMAESDEQVEARIGIGLGALSTSFATRNALNPPASMTMQLLDGPFSQLEGVWHFEQLGDAGSEVRLQLAFEFSSALQDRLFGAAFEKICDELVDAFVRRARVLYAGDQ